MLVEFAFAEGGERRCRTATRTCSRPSSRPAASRFTVGGESFEVGPGDAFVIPSGVVHGCRAPRAGRACSSTPSPRAGTISSDRHADRRDPPRHRSRHREGLRHRRAAPRTSTSAASSCAGEIRLIYSHYDRMIVGGAVPDGAPLTLDRVAEAGTPSLLDRREIVVVNIGGDGTVAAAGASTPWSRATCSTSAWARAR